MLEAGKLWPHGSLQGEGLGVSCSDQESGALTISLDILNYEVSEDGRSFCLEGTFDCRAPLCCNDRNLTDRIRARLEEAGLRDGRRRYDARPLCQCGFGTGAEAPGIL